LRSLVVKVFRIIVLIIGLGMAVLAFCVQSNFERFFPCTGPIAMVLFVYAGSELVLCALNKFLLNQRVSIVLSLVATAILFCLLPYEARGYKKSSASR